MGRIWSKEQKEAASERMKEKHQSKKYSGERRTPASDQRDITSVHDTPEGYTDRWVNDNSGRIEKFKRYGYELVEEAQVGSAGVDDTHSEQGVVSKDMGKGVTAYLMRQRNDYFKEDQAEKQRLIDETEDSMRQDIKSNETTDGQYGTVKVGRNA